MLNLLKKHNLVRKINPFLFSNIMFVFIVFLISFLILFCSIYFWPENYKLSASIKGTLLDAPVVRGKIIENSLYSLFDFKTFFFGNGWGRIPDLLLENMNRVWEHFDISGMVKVRMRRDYGFYISYAGQGAEPKVRVLTC